MSFIRALFRVPPPCPCGANDAVLENGRMVCDTCGHPI